MRNIRKHIEEDRFPLDDSGRALVSRAGTTVPVTVLATDGPGAYPIIAMGENYVSTWSNDGEWSGHGLHGPVSQFMMDLNRLVMPEPEKVDLVGQFVTYDVSERTITKSYATREEAENDLLPDEIVGELKGEVFAYADA